MDISADPPTLTAASPGSGSISSTSCGAPSDPPASGQPRQPLLYGRRRGRALRPGRKALIGELLPRLSVAIPGSGELDPQLLFGPVPCPIWLEIGFGGGEHLAFQAE